MSARARASAYWGLVALLLGFGVLGMLSIGMPFLVLGVALALLSPVRGRPSVFWPALTGVVAFLVAFVLFAPLGCTTSAAAASAPGGPLVTSPPVTTCTNLLGIHYRGTGLYNPSLLPPFLGALAVGTFVWLAGRLLAQRMEGTSPHAQATAS